VKLSELSSKPELKKVVLDDEEIQKEFGEAIEFYTWDRQPIDLLMKMATITQESANEIIDIVSALVLDENGKPVLVDGKTIPTSVMLKVINAVVEDLGKL